MKKMFQNETVIYVEGGAHKIGREKNSKAGRKTRKTDRPRWETRWNTFGKVRLKQLCFRQSFSDSDPGFPDRKKKKAYLISSL